MLAVTLTKHLRDFTLEVSLELGAETYVLVGHSGCGKTTTLQVLAGLADPDDGRVTLDEHVLVDTHRGTRTPAESRNAGYLVQSYALFPHLSVAGNVAYGLARLPRAEQHRRVEEMLTLVGMRHLPRARPGELSSGQQQRVALARALARRPGFLLLDEPLSALDVATRAGVRAELAAILGQMNIPTVVVTHDYEDARVLADRIAVMDRGHLVQTGTPDHVARYPVNAFVAAFTGTNLAPHGDGQDWHLAFDPWRVQVARHPAGAAYEWPARVRDVIRMGAFDRLRLHGDTLPTSLFADVPSDTSDREPWGYGAEVYAGVAADAVRFVPAPDGAPAAAAATQSVEPEHPPLPLRRGRPRATRLGLLSAVAAVILAGIYLATSTALTGGGKTAGAPADTSMTALVAANMTEAFGAASTAYEKRHRQTRIQASYAGTQILFTQLQQGAPADLFISADRQHARRARNSGIINRFYPVSQMHLVIIVPEGNPAGVHTLKDLGTKPLELVIGTRDVPVGRYTRQMLHNAETAYGPRFSERVKSRVVSLETDTKKVTQKAATGAADAAIVYRTDVTPSIAKKVNIIDIPPGYNETATNYAAVHTDADTPRAARNLIDFMRSPTGQKIISRFHYDTIRTKNTK